MLSRSSTAVGNHLPVCLLVHFDTHDDCDLSVLSYGCGLILYFLATRPANYSLDDRVPLDNTSGLDAVLFVAETMS